MYHWIVKIEENFKKLREERRKDWIIPFVIYLICIIFIMYIVWNRYWNIPKKAAVKKALVEVTERETI